MKKCEPRPAFKKCPHLGTRIKALLPHVPRLQCGARDMPDFGGLTLRAPLSLESAILIEQCGASAPLPSLLTISMAQLHGMHYSAHGYLLPKLIPCEKWMAKDGEVATAFQALAVWSSPEASSLTRWP